MLFAVVLFFFKQPDNLPRSPQEAKIIIAGMSAYAVFLTVYTIGPLIGNSLLMECVGQPPQPSSF